MPACAHCGRQNPEGTSFCGFCAAPLTPAAAASAGEKTSTAHFGAPPGKPEAKAQSKAAPPEFRRPVPEEAAQAARKGGIEFLPWSELSGGQKAGRAIALGVAALIVLLALRGVIRMTIGERGASAPAPSGPGAIENLSAGDRKDGIVSLCKVFQIYGMPKTRDDADAAAKNAAELFKLAGNQSPEQSAIILRIVAQEFSNGRLGTADCAAAGQPIGAPTESGGNPGTPTP